VSTNCSNLTRHVESFHVDHVCKHCGKTVIGRKNLGDHLRKKHQIKTSVYFNMQDSSNFENDENEDKEGEGEEEERHQLKKASKGQRQATVGCINSKKSKKSKIIFSNVSGGGNCEAISDGAGVSLKFSEYP
jgi:predicted RNA-binding Zn-ribbon protein involved in translation (DUF1610 family)